MTEKNNPADKPLYRRLVRRNPYRVEHLPALARLHQAAYSPSRRMRHELPKLPLRPLVSWTHRMGWGGIGTVSLRVKGETKHLRFNARNLQFASLYMPQLSQGYEAETFALLDALVGPEAVFYDVGSNWGYYALAIAARPDFQGQVHAFEPMPGSFGDLDDLVAQSGLGRQVFRHNVGLSQTDATGRMVLADGMHSGLAKVSASGGVKAVLRRLDGLGLPPPAVIKLDVEDHEFEALTGARAVLTKHAPYLVFESVWGRQEAASAMRPFELLQELGYVFYHPTWTPDVVARLAAARAWAPPADEETTLELVPFALFQRFLLREQLNVLACHRDRLGGLAALFCDR